MRTRLRVNLFATLPMAVTGMILLGGCASSAGPAAPTPSRSAAATVAKAPLKCDASVTSRHPADFPTTVGIRVRTAPHPGDQHHRGVPALHGHARPPCQPHRRAYDRVPDRCRQARVPGCGQCHHLTARPEGILRDVVHPAEAAAPRGALHRQPRHPSTPAPATSAASCYPLGEGTCRSGEFCRDSDHGASGVAGDGEKIVCEDNDGWRWEPA